MREGGEATTRSHPVTESLCYLGLTGKIIEVNLVFELVSGFSAAEVVGNTPCGPPLFGSLSIMPSAFLRAFSEVSAVPQLNNAGDPLEHTRGLSEQQAVSPNSSSSPLAGVPVHSVLIALVQRGHDRPAATAEREWNEWQHECQCAWLAHRGEDRDGCESELDRSDSRLASERGAALRECVDLQLPGRAADRARELLPGQVQIAHTCTPEGFGCGSPAAAAWKLLGT
jgi:hypothetical protein